MRADGATAKVTRMTRDRHGEKRQELTRQSGVVTEALAALDAAGLCDAADYAPESMEFLDGEIIEIEARRENGQYTRLAFINPDTAPDQRVRAITALSKRLIARP